MNVHILERLDRRQLLKIGSLSLGGLLPGLSRATAAGGSTSDTSVILLWLAGGPSHMDTYDLKPSAPAEYRGEFQPIATNVPGIDVCELLPRHAQVADRFSLIRSIGHNFGDHGDASRRFFSGREPSKLFGTVNEHPAIGSMIQKIRGSLNDGVPTYVAGVDAHRQDIHTYSLGAAYLGASTHPMLIPGDPSHADFRIPNLSLPKGGQSRIEQRFELLTQFDRFASKTSSAAMGTAIDEFNDRARSLLQTGAAERACDLSLEPASIRQKYGMHPWGQRALLARRLAEAGSKLVIMALENPVPPGIAPPDGVLWNWDVHPNFANVFKDSKYRFPIFDQTVTALIEDIYDRGVDKKIMVIVAGEIGRSPRITYMDGRPGRDHCPQAMSALVSGGGLQMGKVIGSTNAVGEHPKDRPVSPNDLWATALQHLGVDYANTTFTDHSGRPMPMMPTGTPIAELI